ncbi:MAG: ATP-grasp domain-containing protein [Acidobacteriota bacterium]|nr:ATP-grasp domain-containing protein [Blastocatellia bacterium]MDW8238653.1 ATP-grasp domain-containing protein [Acidobacteriota bacterium]
MSMNIMFTSVGRRVELVRAFRRAYQALGLDGRIIGLDMDPLAPALQLVDRPYIVPRLDAPDYIPTLIGICRAERVNLIFPLIDPDIPLLARHKSALEATGARVVVVSEQAAEMAADKWRTVEFFQRLSIPTPRSWLPTDINPSAADYPLFIKPRGGSAAQHTYRVQNARELAFFVEYVPNPIIQEYLPGPEITNDVICDLDGEVMGVISRRRMEVRWGEVAKGVTLYDPEITHACVRIAHALSAIGPITIQCMMKDGVAHFTEINARWGGGAPLGIAAGADSPRWLLARAAGLAIEVPPLGAYQTGLFITRYDDAFYLTEAQREQMAGHRL